MTSAPSAKAARWAMLGTAFLISAVLGSCQPPTASGPRDAAEEEVEAPDILTLVYSRTVSTLNPHLATGFQDFEAARIIYEPLASYDAAGNLVPVLATEIPSRDNDGLSADGRRVIWQLDPAVRWTDGEPFTADDVVFTYEFITNPEVAAVTAQYYEGIEAVNALDEHRVEVVFTEATPSWQMPFTGINGLILPQHEFEDFNSRQAREAPANFQPVGTGPYRYLTQANDRLLFAPNELYPRPVGFRRVEIQGNVAPYVAARDVLKTGTADFAHNIQLESAALVDLVREGETGSLTLTFGSQVERIMVNFADPNQETEAEEKASLAFPHPFLSDVRVRQAIDYAIDRGAIVSELYGDLGRPISQLLVNPSPYQADIAFEHSPEKARQQLEEAGWQDTDGDGVRDRDGVPMQLVFQTSLGTIRQATQELVQGQLAAVGLDVVIERVRPEDFFSADPQETRSINHFYADLQEYAIGNAIPDPIIYMGWWTCENIASLANSWQKPNNARYCDRDYDRLWAAARTELDPDRRIDLFHQMDRKLAEDVAVLPIVHRALANAVSERLAGYAFTPWDASTWNIAQWRALDTEASEPETGEEP